MSDHFDRCHIIKREDWRSNFKSMEMFEELLDTSPYREYLPQYDPDCGEGTAPIKAIAYDGVNLEGKKTKVFAFIAFPENCASAVPAVVLVHGAGCHPDCAWMNEWTRRGYAVIAPDTTGYFPGEQHTSFTESNRGNWQHELPADIGTEEYTAAPMNTGMRDIDRATGDRFIYHAVSQVILAHNILREDERIDNQKIGISGISWGGVIASIVIGYDTRFSFAIPIYGSAYLAEGLSEIDRPFRWKENECWLAERQYEHVTIPVMWLCWNDDCCFSINSNSHSYVRTVRNNSKTVLSMCHLMHHSHTHAMLRQESYWYAERIISGQDVPHINAYIKGRKLLFSCTEAPKSIKLYYITGKLAYSRREKYGMNDVFLDRDWQILKVDTQASDVNLSNDAAGCYLEFILENDIVLCSQYFDQFLQNGETV